jgi:hypothetical protein
VRVGACHMVLTQRESNDFLEPSDIHGLELQGCKILLDVITQYTF